MDKVGGIKKALITGAMLAAVIGTTMPTGSVTELAENVLNQTEQPVDQGSDPRPPEGSVQVMYRPVLSEKIPGIPKLRGDAAWKWWSIQLRRIKEGFWAPDGHYICGYHYFYLNFVKIPRQDKETKTITGWDSPWYRDNDDKVFSHLWRNRAGTKANGEPRYARNFIKAKPRTIGWTQMEFLGVDMYHFIFDYGRERYIGRGYSAEKFMKAERGWFRTLYVEHIPEFLKTFNGRKLEIIVDNAHDFQVGRRVEKTALIHNWIQYRIVDNENQAGVFKSMRLSKITAVEAGLWPGDALDNFYVENLDCLGGMSQWGMFVIGGTSNAVMNKSSNYKTMYFNPGGYNAVAMFTPKTVALLGYVDLYTGRSEVDRAHQAIMAKREQSKVSVVKYQKELVENPLTPYEAFEPSTAFEYSSAALQAQIAWTKAHGFDKYWRTGKLVYKPDYLGRPTTTVVFVADAPGTPEEKRGPWRVYRSGMPNKNIRGLHVAGIDDTYKGGQEGQKLRKRDSRNCMVIYRQPSSLLAPGNNDMPVAMYYERDPSMQVTYGEFVKGMLFYDIQHTLYEHNGDAFPDYLRERGLLNRLWFVNGKPGLSVKGRQKQELTALGHEWMDEERYVRTTCLPLLESLMLWGSGQNDDIGSAFHLVLFLLHKLKDRALSADERTDYMNGHQQASDKDFIQLGQYANLAAPKPFDPQRDWVPQVHRNDAEYFDQPNTRRLDSSQDDYITLGPSRDSYSTNNAYYA